MELRAKEKQTWIDCESFTKLKFETAKNPNYSFFFSIELIAYNGSHLKFCYKILLHKIVIYIATDNASTNSIYANDTIKHYPKLSCRIEHEILLPPKKLSPSTYIKREKRIKIKNFSVFVFCFLFDKKILFEKFWFNEKKKTFLIFEINFLNLFNHFHPTHKHTLDSNCRGLPDEYRVRVRVNS